MKWAEMHCHTVYSISKAGFGRDSLVAVPDLLKRAKEVGLSAIAITDHDCMNGYEEAIKISEKYGITIIPAEEFETDKMGQMLGYGITKGIVSKRPVGEIVKDIQKSGGLAVIPHPYDAMRKMEEPEMVSKIVDGVEVFNIGSFGNDRAKKLAMEAGVKIMTGGSDAHGLALVGAVRMGFPDWCKKPDDYISCMKAGKTVIKQFMGQRRALLLALGCLVETKIEGILHRKRYLSYE
jgi:predicted metal-dependent phosphoesterase TrpH